jgi:hypothetical protein
VDVPAERRGAFYAHSSQAVRDRSFTDNARAALDLLDTYATQHSRVVSSRLHCHLPMCSIGVETEFRPSNASDIRFDGLIGLGEREFDAIRAGLTGSSSTSCA